MNPDRRRKFMLFGLAALLLGGIAAAGIWYAEVPREPAEFRQAEGIAPEAETPRAAGTSEEAAPEAEAPAPESETEDVSEGSATPVQDAEEPAETETPEPAPKPSSLSITNRLMSSGYAASSGRTIDTIILHSSYNSLGGDKYSVSKIVDIYESYGVSAHYIIGRKGDIYRLVEEKNVSYHAGVSRVPDGRTNANDFSIGIELVNDDKGDEYTDAQYRAVRNLVGDIRKRYSIKYVLGHDDVAPGRKSDPWNFDWDELK